MTRIGLGAMALSLGLVGAAAVRAADTGPITKGMPVVVIGEISSQPRDFGFIQENKLQVAVGPNRLDHTLHLRGSTLLDEHGYAIAKSKLQDKWWVRAEGVALGSPRRIKVKRLTLLGKDHGDYRRSAHFRPGMESGYILAEQVAGVRQVLPSANALREGARVSITAPISSQPRNAGVSVEEKMQVAIGPQRADYTLHFGGARMLGLDGKEMFASGLRDRMWIRAEGTVMDDSRRIKVEHLQVIAGDDETFRASDLYRTGGGIGSITVIGP
ncbi:MAG: hypothetical protein ACO1SX_07690 [Actinomycetota bacterium]